MAKKQTSREKFRIPETEAQRKKRLETIDKIEQLAKEVVEDIKKDQAPYLTVPLRGKSNAYHHPETNIIMPGDKVIKRRYMNVSHTKKFAQMLAVAQACKDDLLRENLHATIRDLYYMLLNIKVPGQKEAIVNDQKESNVISEDLEVALGVLREDLNLQADKKGSVVGNVVIESQGDEINWSKLGSGGWAIPSITDDVHFKSIDADFVLYVEKNAVWERLHEDRIWKDMNCILIATQGQSTRGARRLLHRFSNEFKLPIYVFTDADPWGWYIYSVLKYGSYALPHTSEQLATPTANFVGLTLTDVVNYGLEDIALKQKPVDIARAKEMLSYPVFQSPRWQTELKMSINKGIKAELQSLAKKRLTFISEEYIPEKLEKRDFLD
ncbi:MAG: DNA topoisomerase IV subunit A [DPANN group archaeon]|nr:DNA topoisomerase IV subunit A [DPANN group archaeon]